MSVSDALILEIVREGAKLNHKLTDPLPPPKRGI